MDLSITQELLHELLDYNPDTGVFTWRPRDIRWFKSKQAFKAWNTRFAGMRAGTENTMACGFKSRKLRLPDKVHYEHRLVWTYMTGELPPQEIDHINRDATDNRWSNLRNAAGCNSKNRSMFKSNTSGFTGVRRGRQSSRWEARAMVDKKYYHLGTFDSPEEAASAVSNFHKEHGFTLCHGKMLAPYHQDNIG